MAKESKNEKIITIILAIVISLAAITIMYVSLPNESKSNQQENNTGGEVPAEKTILTLIYGDQELEYTLSDLEGMEAYNGSGSQLKIGALPDIIIDGPYDFTGVRFTTLLSQFEDLPDNYNITVTSTDNWTNVFTKDQVNGVVSVYNETGNITVGPNPIMMLAYKEDGEYITDDTVGPTRVVFVGENAITSSRLWAKMVSSIEVTEV